MRIIVQSKHSLVIETKGKLTLLLLLAVIALHALLAFPWIVQLFEVSHDVMAVFMVMMSIGLYIAAAYLLLGPLADKRIITFNGQKYEITIDHKIPGNLYPKTTISFRDFERFEISPPEHGGFCRIRFDENKTRMLFRVKKYENYDKIKQIGDITRKSTKEVLE
ncbi:MAG: hypothetical protein ACLFUS_05555 [Candidatus Sumerlaeia bacterium]